jgi:hypothetical protein
VLLVPASHVRTYGVEPDPAKRLRLKWGAAMRATRNDLGITLDELAAEMAEAGYPVTAQAISSWERGDTSPRPHHQIGWCKVTRRQHHEVFVMTDEAA